MAVDVIKQIYKPMMTVGQVYAKVWGTATSPKEIGNTLELVLEHSEDVQTQDDMTKLGGGVHAEVRRVKDVKVKMKLADLNVVNIARGLLANIAPVEAGTVTDMPYTVSELGVLIPLEHIGATSVVIKKGADAASAQPVDMAGNYEPRHEGIVLLPGSAGLAAADKLWISYTHGAYAVIEALTTKAPELQLLFGGMNEADSGNPMVVDLWRCSQGITKQFALVNKGFSALDIEGTLMMDPTKTGSGISKYYRARMA